MANQPNFNAMSQALATMSQEVTHCGGLAGANAVVQAQLANIQATLQRLDRRSIAFDRRLTAIDRRLTAFGRRLTASERRLQTRLDQLETRMMASDNNAIARNHNSRANDATSPLHPLRSIATNAAIPGFPQTLGRIDTMNIQELRLVLRALGQNTRGRAVVLRDRLRVVVGAVTQGVVWR